MQAVANALLPILALIATGHLLRRSGMMHEGFWPSVDKLCYYILAPALLIRTLASQDLNGLPWEDIALAVATPVLASATLLWIWRLACGGLSPQSFTSVFQGGVRFNGFVGLAIASALFGDEGIVIAALIIGVMTVLINLLCVTTFVTALAEGRVDLLQIISQLAKNPLIVACLTGGLLNLGDVEFAQPLDDTLALLGRIALPMALIGVGGALQLSKLHVGLRHSAVSGTAQFIVKPLLAVLCCQLLGLSGVTALVVILFLTVPTSPASYALARQLGGDSQLMASIIAQQTLVAFVSIPATLWLVGML